MLLALVCSRFCGSGAFWRNLVVAAADEGSVPDAGSPGVGYESRFLPSLSPCLLFPRSHSCVTVFTELLSLSSSFFFLLSSACTKSRKYRWLRRFLPRRLNVDAFLASRRRNSVTLLS